MPSSIETDQIRRHSLYFPAGAETAFGWLHQSCKESAAVVAVICNPLGVEYMSGHRSIRHLADQLAINGIDALRFDYANTGDSSGGSFEHVNIAGVLRDITGAVNFVRGSTGKQRVVLVGIGLGATFAALASQMTAIDHLVLWNPTVSGRRFVREQKLLSDVLTSDDSADAQTTDVAGILLTARLQDEFREIDLTSLDYARVESVLLIDRTDRKANAKLVTAIESTNERFESVSMSGYKEMMDQPTDTVVPTDVFAKLTDWSLQQTALESATDPARKSSSVSFETRMPLVAGDHATQPLTEIAETFGENGRLFGIVSVRQDIPVDEAHPKAFVFLNCGSEHHAGPHRLYTILARHCASFGILCFRFDIEGIGDSISVGNNPDNNSYSPVALDDIEQALAFLKSKYRCEEFVLNGICAGAYHSFKGLATMRDYSIPEANLINPLVFEWNYDDPDDHLKFETHTYRSAVRKASSWRRLFSGDINYRRLIRSFGTLLFEYIRRLFSRVMGAFSRAPAIGLPADMTVVLDEKRMISLVLAEGDPGLDIMKLQAARETKLAIKRGLLTTHSLKHANHGLSKKTMQDQLVDFYIRKYGERRVA